MVLLLRWWLHVGEAEPMAAMQANRRLIALVLLRIIIAEKTNRRDWRLNFLNLTESSLETHNWVTGYMYYM